MDPVVVCSAKRTPIGGFQGGFSSLSAPELGGAAIKAAVRESATSADSVDELLMGCVLPAGQGQAPARQAGFCAGLPKETPASTVNKMCGSGMKTIMLAHDSLALGRADTVVAGGMESMTNAPYLLPRMRQGARIGHAQAVDHMFFDGLEDAYDGHQLMGEFAEDCAAHYQFTRQDQDRYAIQSLRSAREAQSSGAFSAELEPVHAGAGKQRAEVCSDEQPLRAKPERIPDLKPAFRKNGTVTAANSSSISDGAAALVLSREQVARRREMPILGYFAGHATFAQEPRHFPTSPIHAVKKLLDEISWRVDEVDLWEVNEAFAVVAMAFMKEFGIPRGKLNIHGGACALGHPIGASGARIVATLLHAMERISAVRGVAAICIGGGEATAVAIERR